MEMATSLRQCAPIALKLASVMDKTLSIKIDLRWGHPLASATMPSSVTRHELNIGEVKSVTSWSTILVSLAQCAPISRTPTSVTAGHRVRSSVVSIAHPLASATMLTSLTQLRPRHTVVKSV